MTEGCADDTPRCQEVLADLQAYLDGELPEDAIGNIAQHLDDCPPCDDTAEDFAALKEAIRRYRCGVDDASLERLRLFTERLLEQPTPPA